MCQSGLVLSPRRSIFLVQTGGRHVQLSVLKLSMHCVGIRAGVRVALALNGGHRSTTSNIEVISKWLNMPLDEITSIIEVLPNPITSIFEVISIFHQSALKNKGCGKLNGFSLC